MGSFHFILSRYGGLESHLGHTPNLHYAPTNRYSEPYDLSTVLCSLGLNRTYLNPMQVPSKNLWCYIGYFSYSLCYDMDFRGTLGWNYSDACLYAYLIYPHTEKRTNWRMLWRPTSSQIEYGLVIAPNLYNIVFLMIWIRIIFVLRNNASFKISFFPLATGFVLRRF